VHGAAANTGVESKSVTTRGDEQLGVKRVPRPLSAAPLSLKTPSSSRFACLELLQSYYPWWTCSLSPSLHSLPSVVVENGFPHSHNKGTFRPLRPLAVLDRRWYVLSSNPSTFLSKQNCPRSLLKRRTTRSFRRVNGYSGGAGRSGNAEDGIDEV
jgi:hypothetical protein